MRMASEFSTRVSTNKGSNLPAGGRLPFFKEQVEDRWSHPGNKTLLPTPTHAPAPTLCIELAARANPLRSGLDSNITGRASCLRGHLLSGWPGKPHIRKFFNTVLWLAVLVYLGSWESYSQAQEAQFDIFEYRVEGATRLAV